MSIRAIWHHHERDRRRVITDRSDYLADLSEEFDEAKAEVTALGDRAEASCLTLAHRLSAGPPPRHCHERQRVDHELAFVIAHTAEVSARSRSGDTGRPMYSSARMNGKVIS